MAVLKLEGQNDVGGAERRGPYGSARRVQQEGCGYIRASGESALCYNENKEGKVIDHIILTVSDFERSVAFYAKALKPLGITNFIDYEGQDGHPDLKGFGDGKRA